LIDLIDAMDEASLFACELQTPFLLLHVLQDEFFLFGREPKTK